MGLVKVTKDRTPTKITVENTLNSLTEKNNASKNIVVMKETHQTNFKDFLYSPMK